MDAPKIYIYADFQNLDDANRLRLTCVGTLQDLERQGVRLADGLVVTLYTDDADDSGQPDEMRAEGVVHYDEAQRCWVAEVDWDRLRHASDEPVFEEKSMTPHWSSLPAFATLDLCLAHIQSEHPQRFLPHAATDIDTGESIQAQRPAYLYRGEVGWFDECLSRMERVRRGQFPGVTTQELDPIRQDLDHELRARLELDPKLSAGLMQHYGFPTELMDATASLNTAACFSRLGAGGTAVGGIAVFDMSVLAPNAIVVDFSAHAAAIRARRQEAYGVFHQQYRDLKRPQAMSNMGITWYTFLTDPLEAFRVPSGAGLLSVSDDETAGILRLWLDGSIAKHGKVSHPVAEYLAYRIAHCPLVARVESWHGPGQPDQIVLVPPGDANIPIDEQVEIATSIKVWSHNFPDITSRPMIFGHET